MKATITAFLLLFLYFRFSLDKSTTTYAINSFAAVGYIWMSVDFYLNHKQFLKKFLPYAIIFILTPLTIYLIDISVSPETFKLFTMIIAEPLSNITLPKEFEWLRFYNTKSTFDISIILTLIIAGLMLLYYLLLLFTALPVVIFISLLVYILTKFARVVNYLNSNNPFGAFIYLLTAIFYIMTLVLSLKY